MTQIGGYLTPDEHSAFKRYAAEFQLKESSLANLLIVRELRLRRLDRLKQFFHRGSRLTARRRVTAHQSNPQTKEAFEALAREADISPDQAASIVFRAELSERWLAHALSRDWNQFDSI